MSAKRSLSGLVKPHRPNPTPPDPPKPERPKFKDGQVLFEGKFSHWATHPDGVVIKQGNKLLLNGEECLYEDQESFAWDTNPHGVVIRKGERLLQDGKVLCEGIIDAGKWSGHAEGVVTWRGNTLYVNTGKQNYECSSRSFRVGGVGIVIEYDKTFRLNGIEPICRGFCDDWKATQKGVVLRMGNHFLLNGRHTMLVSAMSDKHPWDSSWVDGIVVQYFDELVFHNWLQEDT